MNKNFEKIRTSHIYDPHSGESPKYKSYTSVITGEEILREVEVLTGVLSAIVNGIPKPYDPSVMVRKIEKIERERGCDLEVLKNCCAPANEVREAKDLKPLIFAIKDRIVELMGLKNYVDRYTN